MNQAEQKAVHQQSHGIIQRDKPEGRYRHRLMEKGFGYNGNHIPEITAEHDAPERGRDSAVHKQRHHLLHSFCHIRILFQKNKASYRHQNAVTGIPQHQTEQEIVKDRHDSGRIDLPLVWQSVGLHHALGGTGKAVVLKEHRRLFLLRNFLQLYLTVIFSLQLCLQRLRTFCRNVSVQEKYMLRLQKSSENSVFLRTQLIIVRCKLYVLPLACQGFQFFNGAVFRLCVLIVRQSH